MKRHFTLIATLLALSITSSSVILVSTPVANASVIDIGVIGGVDYFYDETNDRTWVDLTFAVNLTSESAESAVNNLGLSFATQAQMTALIASIGGTGTALYDNVKTITNSLSSSTILGWMGPNFSLPFGTYEVYANGNHQAVGRSSNAPLTSFNHSVWASREGDLREDVPEPTTSALVLAATLFFAIGRRRGRW